MFKPFSVALSLVVVAAAVVGCGPETKVKSGEQGASADQKVAEGKERDFILESAALALAATPGKLFLKIEGIEGESKDKKHAKELEIATYSWGELNTSSSSSGGGGGAGRVVMDKFSFTSTGSIATPKLFLAAANGRHIEEVKMTIRATSGQDYMTWTLKDVMVTSFQHSGAVNNAPDDSFAMSFRQIIVSYSQVQPNGTLAAPVTAGWDVAENHGL